MADAVILLFLSDFKANNEFEIANGTLSLKPESDYSYTIKDKKGRVKEKKAYGGRQTNEAPIRCLIDSELGNDTDTLKKIICITSKKVRTELLGDIIRNDWTLRESWNSDIEECELFQQYKDLTQYDLFCRKIKENYYPDEDVPGDLIADISYNYEKDDPEFKKFEDDDVKAVNIYKQIVDEMKGLSEAHVYLDYSGGMRDTSFLMTTIIRYLEFSDIKLEKIIYSEYNPYQIHDIRYIYNMFQVINGVSEFITTGRATILNEVCRLTLPRESVAFDLISSIREFSERILLGKLDDFQTVLDNIAANIYKVEKDENKYDLQSELMRSLCPVIKEKMHITEEGFTYPSIIRWCVENDMIQQALTIYVEKMPEYYFESCNIREYIPDYVYIPRESKSIKYAEIYYSYLFDGLLEDKKCGKLKVLVNKIANRHDVNWDLEKFCTVVNEMDNQEKEAISLKKLVDRIMKHGYDSYGFVVNDKASDIRFSFALSEKKKDRNCFLDSLAGNGFISNRLRLLVTTEFPDWKKIKNLSGSTYARKKSLLFNEDKLHERCKEVEPIIPSMKFYLYIKMKRNQIIHVSGDERDDSYEEVKNYFNTETKIKYTEDINDLKQNILDGLESLKGV